MFCVRSLLPCCTLDLHPSDKMEHFQSQIKALQDQLQQRDIQIKNMASVTQDLFIFGEMARLKLRHDNFD